MYNYQLGFKLNERQQEISKKILDYYLNNEDVVIDAVCGAGKTEMLLETIKYALNKGKNIGFASPRKQLTIELYQRIVSYFDYDGAGLVVGGINKNGQSNLIFLTTHQLIKYQNYFDLLIIDEIDAFPYCDNFRLENAALLSAKQFIYLSATVPEKYLKLVNNNSLRYLSNEARHHNKVMPVPLVLIKRSGLALITLVKLCKKLQENPLIIFVATINKGKKLVRILSILKFNVKFVCGSTISQDIMDEFRKGVFNVLVSTTVLERGITLKKLNVIVFEANSKVFSKQALIQISGRVGRDSEYSEGYIYFITKNVNENIQTAVNQIREYNEMLRV